MNQGEDLRAFDPLSRGFKYLRHFEAARHSFRSNRPLARQLAHDDRLVRSL
jgi:hypothetical protein